VVLTSGLALVMYPWDVYVKLSYSACELQEMGIADRARQSDEDGARSLAGRLLYREMRHFEMTTAGLGDAGAVAAAVLPDALTLRRLHVSVEMKGDSTRGMTVCDLRDFTTPPDLPKRAPNVDVITDIDAAAMKELFSELVFRHHSQGRGQKRPPPDGNVQSK